MKYRLVGFDIDGTLAESKQPLRAEMAQVLRNLLEHAEVMITSGAEFSLIQTQIIEQLKATPEQLQHLHIMPANGSAYYRYDLDSKAWKPIYTQDLSLDEQKRVVSTVEQTARKLHLWERHPHGEIVEDRGSEVTYSALGQHASLNEKSGWDPKTTKRRRLRTALARLLPGYSVRIGGMTSVDVTQKGVTKAAALLRLKEVLGIKDSAVIYIGDAMGPGGNDAVVKQAGFHTLITTGPAETAKIIKDILAE